MTGCRSSSSDRWNTKRIASTKLLLIHDDAADDDAKGMEPEAGEADDVDKRLERVSAAARRTSSIPWEKKGQSRVQSDGEQQKAEDETGAADSSISGMEEEEGDEIVSPLSPETMSDDDDDDSVFVSSRWTMARSPKMLASNCMRLLVDEERSSRWDSEAQRASTNDCFFQRG